MARTIAQRLAAEGLGTGLLLAGVVGSGIMAAALADGNVAVALLANAIATGAILYVLISALGPVSGAHFNPAVTVWAAASRALPAPLACAYVAVQIAGAVGGVALAHFMFDLPALQVGFQERAGTGQWLSEAVATFGLVLTIASARNRPDAAPALVALYITAAYWFTASTAFANPAATIGRALTVTFAGIAPADAPGFIAAQAVGATLGGLFSAWLFEERIAPPPG
ncbi:Aquaporin Z [Alphaproteobacteria bacterium SO-S41]|nr:Aquaporin Z [Alphaproteobacteria bacterium SO-S41]